MARSTPSRGRKAANRSAPASRRAQDKAGSGTTSLLLRDIPPDVLAVLRARAERSGASVQQELRASLRRDTRLNFEEALALSRAWRERLQGLRLPPTIDLLREGRDR